MYFNFFMDIQVHTLDINKHKHFLEEERFDPVTKEKFRPGDRIVLCASCKSAFLLDSWNAMGGTHCNQNSSLSRIPSTTPIIVRKKSSSYSEPELSSVARRGSVTLYNVFGLIGGIGVSTVRFSLRIIAANIVAKILSTIAVEGFDLPKYVGVLVFLAINVFFVLPHLARIFRKWTEIGMQGGTLYGVLGGAIAGLIIGGIWAAITSSPVVMIVLIMLGCIVGGAFQKKTY